MCRAVGHWQLGAWAGGGGEGHVPGCGSCAAGGLGRGGGRGMCQAVGVRVCSWELGAGEDDIHAAAICATANRDDACSYSTASRPPT